MTLPKAIIVELDGCLADNSHRLHWVDPEVTGWIPYTSDYTGSRLWSRVENGERKVLDWQSDWKKYHEEMKNDKVNEGIHQIVRSMAIQAQCQINVWEPTKVEVIFITGRSEKYRKITSDWLDNWQGLWCKDKLFMRPEFDPSRMLLSMPPKQVPDTRTSHEVKREIYLRDVKPHYDVMFVLEADQESCEMYKELGLTVLRVL